MRKSAVNGGECGCGEHCLWHVRAGLHTVVSIKQPHQSVFSLRNFNATTFDTYLSTLINLVDEALFEKATEMGFASLYSGRQFTLSGQRSTSSSETSVSVQLLRQNLHPFAIHHCFSAIRLQS